MGFLTSVFDIALGKPAKTAQPWPNAANLISKHIAAKWPELVGIPGLWFSGSQVWSFVYDKEPPAASDWDIFCLRDAAKVMTYETGFHSLTQTERSVLDEVMYRLKVPREAVTERKAANPLYQSRGYDIKHERGDIDIWTSEAQSVQQQLRLYPGTHTHCRAAFSFTEGLVVLPNEAAQ